MMMMIYMYTYSCITALQHENVASNIEQVLAAAPHKRTAVRPQNIRHENYEN